MKTRFFENEAQENNVFEIVKTKEKKNQLIQMWFVKVT
jgi:hypothetical protein